eukprot:SAG31_NODE_5365_length_2584_cov_1.362575_1_plen_97_part_00
MSHHVDKPQSTEAAFSVATTDREVAGRRRGGLAPELTSAADMAIATAIAEKNDRVLKRAQKERKARALATASRPQTANEDDDGPTPDASSDSEAED